MLDASAGSISLRLPSAVADSVMLCWNARGDEAKAIETKHNERSLPIFDFAWHPTAH
jgi:hypothetical protein